eukprot:m.715197 g.715197  ORF g.715197 m.715197 type:complete len:214 (-) comp22978_c0_seq7:3359-4000(-)
MLLLMSCTMQTNSHTKLMPQSHKPCIDLHNASFPSYKVPLSVSMSPNISGDLVAVGGGASNNVSALLSFADSEPVALRWGEVVPLHFMRRTLAHVQQSEMGSKNGGDATRVAILSIPTRRYKHDLEMIPGLLDLGGKIGAYLQASPLRVAVVVSADLAHTHQASGPYGFSPAAKPFDTACARWGGACCLVLSRCETLECGADMHGLARTKLVT